MRPYEIALEKARKLSIARFYYKNLQQYCWVQCLVQKLWAIALPTILRLGQFDEPNKLALEKARKLWLSRLYYKHLRQYQWVQRLVQMAVPFIMPFILRFSKPTIHGRLFWSTQKAIFNLSLKHITLAPAETLETPAPTFYPKEAGARIRPPHASYEFPAITATSFPNATVQGGSNFIFLDRDIVVHHDLYDFTQDFTGEEMHSRATISPRKKTIRWYDEPVALPPLPRAATLIDSCAANYAHWMTEVLPRAAMLAAQPEYDGIPVLVDAGLHANLYESLKLVIGDRPIHLIARHESISVEELIVISPTGYVPFEWRKRNPKNPLQGIFSPHALNLLRSRLVNHIQESSRTQAIYIRRNSAYRLIHNAAEIEQLLLEHGATGIEPEKMSFIDQIAAFNGTDMLIGQGGAALVNLVFCRPGTRIIIFNVDIPKAAHWYWQNMARATGNHVYLVLGTPDNLRYSHTNFTLDPSAVAQAIA